MLVIFTVVIKHVWGRVFKFLNCIYLFARICPCILWMHLLQ